MPWTVVDLGTSRLQDMTRTIICYPFVGDSVGGSHISMVPVIDAMPEFEFDPVVAIHQLGPLSDYLESINIDFVQTPPVQLVEGGTIPTQIARMILSAYPLAAFLRRNHVSIVHTNDARIHFTWGLAARLAGCKFVWHQRSGDNSRRLSIYSRLSHAVVTISEYCRSIFPPSMASRSIIIHDPVAVTSSVVQGIQIRQKLLAEMNLDSACTIVGFVGNLTWQKRPLFFVDIASAIRDSLGETVLFPIFGEKRSGLTGAVQEHIRKHDLSRQCHLMGPRYPIEPWIGACDILIAPAKAEGLGRTLVEAMLAGTPVVAADDAGHREVIEHDRTGMLVSPDDPKAFAYAVTRLLQDDAACKKICSHARAFAIEAFSVEKHIRKTTDIYRQVLGKT